MEFPVKRLLSWFAKNRRDLPWRRRRGIYSTWVSEVMLQQTRINIAVPYFKRFMKLFPTVADLAAADLQQVLKAWEGLGYYSRARNLHRAARTVARDFAGRIPDEPGEFRGLPGVGPYIAAAVLSIARGRNLPVVDGNVLRVVCRFAGHAADIRRPSTRSRIAKYLEGILPGETPGRFNEALMELGALVCLPRAPRCGRCPLRQACFARRGGEMETLPHKSAAREIPSYEVALALLVRRGKLYVQKRPDQGHLGGLWEFPGGKARPGESLEDALVRECREELGVRIKPLRELAAVRHAYTHFRVRLHLFACSGDLRRLRPRLPHRWIAAEGLGTLPFPGANHKLFPAVIAHLESRR